MRLPFLLPCMLLVNWTAAFTTRGATSCAVLFRKDQRIAPLFSDFGDSQRANPPSMIDQGIILPQEAPIDTKFNSTPLVTEALPQTVWTNNARGTFLVNLPVEADQALTIDQKILGAVLREPSIEIFGVVLVLMSSLLVALSTVNTIGLQSLASIIRLENAIAYIFAIEFFVRWYAQFTWKGIFSYLILPLVLVDLVVVILPLIPLIVPNTAEAYNILPSWLFSSAGLVNLRLLRVLKLQRVLADMDTFADFQMALGISRTEVKPYKLQLARVILSIFTLLSVSTGLIYSTEHTVNPDIPDYFTALYFGLTTLTTVGFGDITPVTPEGKLVVSGTILAGVAVIPTQVAALVEALLAREDYKQKASAEKKAPRASTLPLKSSLPIKIETVCSNCNAGYHWASADFCWSCGSKLPLDEQ